MNYRGRNGREKARQEVKSERENGGDEVSKAMRNEHGESNKRDCEKMS